MDILNDILSKAKPIPETTNFDPKNFKKNFLNKRSPIVLRGYGNTWEAKSKWTLDFLANLESPEPVTLEIGANNQKETNFVKHDLKGYINSIINEESKGKKDRPYLTLFNIFKLHPELKKDIDLSIFTRYTKMNDVFAWIGPEGTVTGFHYDSINNILAQVMGKKLVILASPKDNKNMYKSKKYELGATSSEVDINDYDEKRHPNVDKVEFFSVVLEPGDALFIPKKWWHYVRSLDTSISISNFGSLLSDLFITKPFESIQYRIHSRGFYKKNNCTCHIMVDGKRKGKFAI